MHIAYLNFSGKFPESFSLIHEALLGGVVTRFIVSQGIWNKRKGNIHKNQCFIQENWVYLY